MKTGLSASKYIRNNKRTCFVLILALGLTFMTMYVINYLMMVTNESLAPVCLELPKKITYADLTPESMGIDLANTPQEERNQIIQKTRQSIVDRLKKINGIRNAYYTQVINTSYFAVLGGVSYEFPLLTPEDIPEVLDHVGAKLVEGTMPAGDGELLVDSCIMKNSNLSIGDWFMESAYGKVFKVTGVIESDYRFCIGTPNGFNNSGWYFVILTDEAHSDFSKIAEELGIKTSDLDIIEDQPGYKAFYHDEVESVSSTVIFAILLVVMIFLAISVLVAYISFMRNRANEYCLYTSIGFSKREVYGMIMREMGINFGSGILLGVICAALAMWLLDLLLIHPQGLISGWWYPEHFLSIIAAFTAIIGLLQIPILITVHNIRTIDMIED